MPAPVRARRSPKAGRPPEDRVTSARVRRRSKTAHTSYRKDTMISQAADGPRVIRGVQKPKVTKR